MLSVTEEDVDAFVEALKRYVCNSHGLEVWKECVRDSLTTDARSYIIGKFEAGDIVDTDDLDVFAEIYYDSYRSRIERIEQRLNKPSTDESSKNFSSPAHGSLQNIAAYATLLPPAIRARERILGQREPFSYDEAVVWLEQEAECGEQLAAATVTFELRLPTEEREAIELVVSEEAKAKAAEYWAQRGIKSYAQGQMTGYKYPLDYLDIKTPQDAGKWLEQTLSNHRFLEHERNDRKPYRREWWFQPSISERIRYAHLDDGNSIPLKTEKLTDLAESAEAFLPVARDFYRAVWLILTGKWLRLGVQSIQIRGMPDVPYYLKEAFGDRGTYCLPPITLEVRERETTPEELASYYAEMKRIISINSKTRVLSYESEVIALAALEVNELHGMYMGDKGFYKTVLAHFEKRAPEYGIDPYIDFGKGRAENKRADAVRQALIRIERAHKAMHKAREGRHVDGGYVPDSIFRRWGSSTTA